MKKLLISSIFVLLNLWASYSISAESQTELDKVSLITKTVTFDGYEGEYFFFTDIDGTPIIVEKTKSEKELFKLLQDNVAIGKKFILKFKESSTSNEKMIYANIIEEINYATAEGYSDNEMLVNTY